jgi:hypothetical protein
MNNSGSRTADALRRAQRDFVTARKAGHGKPGYDLRVALQKRLDTLQTAAR